MWPRIALLIAVIFWGWTFVFTRVALAYLSPVELLAIRFLIGVPILGLIVLRKHRKLSFERSELRALGFGSLVLTSHFLIQISGLKYTTATNTGWIISITPLVLAILSWLVHKEKLGSKEIWGILIATGGILLLVSAGDLTSLDWMQSTGDWLVLISAHTWAVYTVVTRNVARSKPPLVVTAAVMLPASIIVIIYVLFTSGISQFVSLGPDVWWAVLYLGIPGTAVAHWFWQEGIAALGGARAGLYLYLEPIATTALAVPFLGEPFSAATAVGGLLVLGGVYIAGRKSAVVKSYAGRETTQLD
jgi:drug/metabolite transporter (DMT)-like permease